jgi:transcription-repair coupling factor (superfamily II helicase)
VDALKIIELVQRHRDIKLAGNDKLRIERATQSAAERAQLVRDTLRSLGTPKADTSHAGTA